jgi:hypothetical protein
MAFATVQEFANHMQATVTNSSATAALEIAKARIQSECGVSFEYVVDDDVTLSGGFSQLTLPGAPVHSIALLETTTFGEIGPVAQAENSIWFRTGSVLTWLGGTVRLNGSPGVPYLSEVWPLSVRVVYTHGYRTTPADAKGCQLLLAAEIYSSPDGAHYESVDDYTWRRGDADATPAAMALKSLKARYGRGIHSLRSVRGTR